MAPSNDNSCSGRGNPLTTLLKKDTTDRSLQQGKPGLKRDNDLGQTMRSKSNEPDLDVQEVCDILLAF